MAFQKESSKIFVTSEKANDVRKNSFGGAVYNSAVATDNNKTANITSICLLGVAVWEKVKFWKQAEMGSAQSMFAKPAHLLRRSVMLGENNGQLLCLFLFNQKLPALFCCDNAFVNPNEDITRC
ncbi:hypothetical protein T07_1918 [Trichinella nelsoni]|uniref:Uncharacterized protein n=1 Tax=Trichinella nelsoni TaxID=6336 RepID=A0A0V0S489_9BILA|nr:hypothetical protein T07_1918 [Trichinella nelsoni]